MLITHNELLGLMGSVVLGGKSSAVNAASIDVHLSGKFLVESFALPEHSEVDVARRESPAFTEISVMEWGVFRMPPGHFVLAATQETFYLPADISALFVMKSSVARCGLDQMNAAWCSPGWSGSALTLELTNVLLNHTLILTPGMPIGQMVFFRGESVPKDVLYSTRGAYNNCGDVSRTKNLG